MDEKVEGPETPPRSAPRAEGGERGTKRSGAGGKVQPAPKQPRVAPAAAATTVVVYDPGLVPLFDSLPVHGGRYRLWALLARACRVLPAASAQLVAPRAASRADLEEYHSADYVAVLERAGAGRATPEELARHGLVDDCAAFPRLWDYVRAVAGATLAAADALSPRDGSRVRVGGARAAINWAGGRHHARRERAAGFCFVNDAVLGILRLIDRGLPRVLYVDLDVHHGDGVEAAFLGEEAVMCVSLHLKRRGFFPGGSGGARETGQDGGRYRNLNLPLREGLTDAQLLDVVRCVVPAAFRSHRADAVVLQCGCDGLAGDPVAPHAWNLSSGGLARAAALVLAAARRHGARALVLGGGGYRPADAARVWVEVTAAACGAAVPAEVPEHGAMLTYAPDFRMRTQASPAAPNLNTPEYVKSVVRFARSVLARVRPPPPDVQA